MNIAHVCLSCFYIDGFNYQENELVRQHVKDGHNVVVIASTENKKSDGERIYSKPGTYIGTDDAKVVRLPYRFWPPGLARKLRVHPGVYNILRDFRPDAILFHGACGWEVTTVARYARENPEVLLYIDSHEDWNNSAQNFVSRVFLHKLYYRFCLRRAWPVARKILCISTETLDFVEEVYRVPRSKLEFYPLGGDLIPESEYVARRNEAREHLGLKSDQILFVQSGKQTKRKKLLETLQAFLTSAPSNSQLVVVGAIDEQIRDEANFLIAKNPKVSFLGWKDAAALTDILCAADVYVQPGTQSVTMQHSLCCHCAVILDAAPSHEVYVKGNGWLIDDAMTLEKAISACGAADLPRMQEESFAIATSLLDYTKLSKRVLRANP